MPCFHDVPRGMTGHASMPRRSGFTDCQTSTYGCPTTRTCGAHGRSPPRRLDDPGLLAAGDEVVDEHAHPAPGPGAEVADGAGEVVDAVEHLDDDALDPQVGAPHLLDELGVVLALDEDPRAAAPPWPALRAPPPSRSRCAPAAARAASSRAWAAARGGISVTGRAVDEEARPEREAPGAAAAVLEVDDVDAARLLDPHDRADPAGLDVLDDRAGLGREVDRPPPRRPRQSPPRTSPPYLSTTAARLARRGGRARRLAAAVRAHVGGTP